MTQKYMLLNTVNCLRTLLGLAVECLLGDVCNNELSLTLCFVVVAVVAVTSVFRFCCSGALLRMSSRNFRSVSLFVRLSLCTDCRCKPNGNEGFDIDSHEVIDGMI